MTLLILIVGVIGVALFVSACVAEDRIEAVHHLADQPTDYLGRHRR